MTDGRATIDRRGALGLIAGGVCMALDTDAIAAASRPRLGSAEQIAAEVLILQLLRDPALAPLQRTLRAELAATPRGRSADGAATLDRAIAMWTNSVVQTEVVAARRTSTILWTTENTPRTWFGHTVGGFGVCGDTPDNIYRAVPLDVGASYEVRGRFDMAHRPSQWVMEVNRTIPEGGSQPGLSKNKADMGNQIAMRTQLDLDVAPDGSFRVPVTASEPCSLLFRDSLDDWTQRASQLTLHQLSGPVRPTLAPDAIRDRIHMRLPQFIRFWGGYLDRWFDNPAPNKLVGPVARDRNWGFLGGFRYTLAPDEALLFRTTQGNATYSSVQITDPWMMTADVRRYQNTLNRAQVAPNADGSVTYVLAARDPGVANWLDTAGVHEGSGIFRWQGTPETTRAADLVPEFRVVKLADAARLSGLPAFPAQQRAAQLATRRTSFETRLR